MILSGFIIDPGNDLDRIIREDSGKILIDLQQDFDETLISGSCQDLLVYIPNEDLGKKMTRSVIIRN
jgi:hypothetical protein